MTSRSSLNKNIIIMWFSHIFPLVICSTYGHISCHLRYSSSKIKLSQFRLFFFRMYLFSCSRYFCGQLLLSNGKGLNPWHDYWAMSLVKAYLNKPAIRKDFPWCLPTTLGDWAHMRPFCINLHQLMPLLQDLAHLVCGTFQRPSVPNLIMLASIAEALCRKSSCMPPLLVWSTIVRYHQVLTMTRTHILTTEVKLK